MIGSCRELDVEVETNGELYTISCGFRSRVDYDNE
jgi:hypothetical protein